MRRWLAGLFTRERLVSELVSFAFGIVLTTVLGVVTDLPPSALVPIGVAAALLMAAALIARRDRQMQAVPDVAVADRDAILKPSSPPDVGTVMRVIQAREQVHPAGAAWEATCAEVNLPSGKDGLSLSMTRVDDSAPIEELECVVIGPDGTPGRAEQPHPFAVDKRTPRQHHAYPWDFTPAKRRWPPDPGIYEVRWLARRMDTFSGGIQRLVLGSTILVVGPDGRITEP